MPGLTMATPSESTVENLQPQIEYNFYGAVTAARAVLPAMREAGAGTLLFTTGGGSINPVLMLGNVNAAAGALRNWVLNLHNELAGSGVYAAHVAISTWIGDDGPEGIPAAIYLGHPQDALGLLGVAAKKATLPATRALVASQTGRVHAALGDEREADRYLGDADGLLADGLGDDVPEWVSYFDAAEHAGARAVSARDLAGLHRGRRVASGHFEDALKLRKPGSTA